MSYLYKSNVSPLQRYEQLAFTLDNGSTGTINMGFRYDLSATERARASRYVVLVLTGSPADSVPVVSNRLPIVGDMQDGDVPVWDENLAAFVPGQPTGGGGGGGPDSSFDLFEDVSTGWPARPTGFASGTWIGWTDPTDLMAEGDRFIAIPVPS